MIKKDKIKIIIRNLIETKNNKKKFNFFFYDTFKNLNQIIKKKGVVIFYGDQALTKFIKVFFYFLYSNVKFKKNCFLLFNPEKTLVIGHNIFPDWPGTYSKNNIFKNITVWTKNFIYIFVFKKRLMLIFIEIL